MIQHYVEVESTLLAAFLSLMLVIVFYAVRPAEERRALMGIALASYLIKAALVPIYFWALVGVGLEGTAHHDPVKFHEQAQRYAPWIEAGRLPPELSGWRGISTWGYSMFCAYLYAWFGPNTLVPRMLNVALSSLQLLYVYRLGKLYFDERVARLAVLLTAFLPFTMLTTLEQRKDPLAQFLSFFVLYHAAVLMKADRRWPRSVAFIALGLVPMSFVRRAFILPFLGIVAISFIAARRNVLMSLIASVPVLLLVGATQFYAPGDSDLSVQANIERVQGKVATEQLRRLRGAVRDVGGLLQYAQIQSPKQVWKLPLSAAVILISPFPPLMPPRFPQLLFHWSNLICLALYPWLFIGVVSILREKGLRERTLLLLFPAVFLILIGAIHPSLTRYREMVFPVILLFIAVGFHRPHNFLISALTYASLTGLAAVVYAARLT